MYIPYAIDSDTRAIIKSDRAIVATDKRRYLCYGCERPVYLVRSKHKRVHFKHYPKEAIGCSYSKPQALHTKAKERVAVVFENALNKCKPMPILQFETTIGVLTMHPFIVGSLVKRELHMKDIKRRPDVAILDACGNVVLAIEIKHKNGVDEKKGKDLAGYFWIEVDANDVIKNELILKVRAHGNLPCHFNIPGQQNDLF
jgi:hypothetical protein